MAKSLEKLKKTNYNGKPLQNQQKKFNFSNKNLLLYLIDHNVKTFSQRTTKQLIKIFDSLKQSLYLQIRQIKSTKDKQHKFIVTNYSLAMKTVKLTNILIG